MKRPSIAVSSRWLLLGTVGSKPAQLVANVALAHMLGPYGLGLLGLTNSAAVTLSGMAGMGLGDAANKFLAEYFRRDTQKGSDLGAVIITFSVAISFATFAGLWFARDWWSPRIFPSGTADLVVGLCLALGWVNVLASLVNNVFSGLQLFRESVLLGLLQVYAISVLSVILGYALGFVGAIVGYIGGSLLFIALSIWRLGRFHGPLISGPRRGFSSHLRAVLLFTLPVWIAYFVVGPLNTLSFAFLAAQPFGAHELGLFNTANALKMLVGMLPGVLTPALSPAIIEEGGGCGSDGAYNLLLERSFAAAMFLSLPIMIPVLFCGDLLFLIYGHQYDESSVLFIPLAASVALTLYSYTIQLCLIAKGYIWTNLMLGAGQHVCFYLLTRWWVVEYLATGLAWANFAASLAAAVLWIEIAIALVAISPRLRGIYYSFLLAVSYIAIAAMLLPAYWRWGLSVPLGVGAAVMLLHRFRELIGWISGSVPAGMRPGLEKIIRIVVPASAAEGG